MDFLTVPLEIKTLKTRQISGLGSVFGNVDLGGDVVAKGAFIDSLAEHEAAGDIPKMFWMHNPEKVAGRWDDMREESDGLLVEGTLAKTPLGEEMRELLKMKAVRGLSIGYYTRDSEFTNDGVRILKELDLQEVSIVSLAMNPLATVQAVKSRLSSAGEYVPTAREFEHKLRDVGLSQSVAKKLVSAAFNEQRDVVGLESEGVAELLATLQRETDDTTVATIRNLTRF